MTDQKSCGDRIHEHLKSRVSDLRTLFYNDQEDDDGNDLGNFYEYGLCFDYVAPGTFEGQDQGYWRYQLSWGGPSDEFRFFAGYSGDIYEIEYWFLDWYDGASRTLSGEDYDLLYDIFEDFKDIGVVDSTFEEATQS